MKKCYMGATLLDPSSEKVISNSAILVKNGRFHAVGANKDIPVSEDAHVVDLTGKFVIPGLIDCHIQSHPATVASLVARLGLAKGKRNGKICTYPTQLILSPVITLQHGSGENASLGIYELSNLLSGNRAKHANQLNQYLKEVAEYVDLTIGTTWRKTIRTAPINGNAW